jgi:hypothetical protein
MPQRKSVNPRSKQAPSRRPGRSSVTATKPRRRSLGSAKLQSRTASQGRSAPWKPRKGHKSATTLSRLTNSVQSALTDRTKNAKKANKGGRRRASALAVLAGSAVVTVGGRLLRRRGNTGPAITSETATANEGNAVGAPTGTPGPSDGTAHVSADAGLAQPTNIAGRPDTASGDEASEQMGSETAAAQADGETQGL